jgi:hypothetical protein
MNSGFELAPQSEDVAALDPSPQFYFIEIRLARFYKNNIKIVVSDAK